MLGAHTRAGEHACACYHSHTHSPSGKAPRENAKQVAEEAQGPAEAVAERINAAEAECKHGRARQTAACQQQQSCQIALRTLRQLKPGPDVPRGSGGGQDLLPAWEA
ncbi:hypothetical protein AOLI_G00244050 [Acnodon oligacanthus]